MVFRQLEAHDHEPMYDPELLKKLDFSQSPTKFNPPVTAVNPGENLLVRPLCLADYDKGFVQLLGQLTSVGDITKEQFLPNAHHDMGQVRLGDVMEDDDDALMITFDIQYYILGRYAEMKACKDTYFITVIEDTITNRIIGAATLVIEQKFIHGCAVRGRLEDVVVNDTYRGKQLGKLIVTTVALLAKTLNCYKITLECKDKLIPFYQSIGYVLEPGNSNSMSIRFDASPKKHSPNITAKL